MRILKLPEYEGVEYARSELDEPTMVLLHGMKPAYVDVQPPFVTGSSWKLTSLGSVGYLPVTENLALSLLPKTPIHNLLRMMEIAYQFRVEWGKSLFEAETLPDLYERLAVILAKRTIDRCRQGIYRTYAGNAEELAYVRGRIDVTPLVRQPWRARLHCEYEEHTADVEENQLILWTLNCILRSGICSEDHARPHTALGNLTPAAYRANQLEQLRLPCRRPATSPNVSLSPLSLNKMAQRQIQPLDSRQKSIIYNL